MNDRLRHLEGEKESGDKSKSFEASHKEENKDAMSAGLVVALAILCCALWGSAVPFVRLGYKQLGITVSDSASQLIFAGIRFFFAGVAVYLYYAIANKDKKISAKDMSYAGRLSAFQTVGQYIFYYLGLAWATGVNGSIIQGVGVFVAVIMSCAIFRIEEFTSRKIFGCILGFGGLLLASGAGKINAGFSLRGEGLMLIGTISSAYAAIQIRKFTQEMNPFKLCGLQFMIGGLVLGLVGVVLGGHVQVTSLPQLLIVLWLIVVSSVAYGLWSMLLRDNDVSRILVYMFLTPIFGVLFSLAILGSEGATIGIHTLAGLVLISLGIIAVQKKKA